VICSVTEMSIHKARKNLANQKRIQISLQTWGISQQAFRSRYADGIYRRCRLSAMQAGGRTIQQLQINTCVVEIRENRPLSVENGKREKWRETHDHVVFLPFAFAVNLMLNLSNTCACNSQAPFSRCS